MVKFFDDLNAGVFAAIINIDDFLVEVVIGQRGRDFLVERP